ncbi:MAG: molybdenum cofactor guanylyltransferase [Ignavibacteria bacterium]|nr:molybdenum cofactor guanylyltransferase [Ignavibacteria bacterium]
MYSDITCIILSGGKSIRMGENKSFLKLGKLTIIERLVNLTKSIFSEVIIITNEPEMYLFLGLPVFSDIYKNVGPPAGIHSGLVNSKTDKNFIISCDIPLINRESIEFIVNYPGDELIKVPLADGFLQHLCGMYNKACLPYIEALIKNSIEEETRHKNQDKRKCKVHQLVNSVDSTIINIETEFPDYISDTFLNMNKPEEYEKIQRLLKM